MHPESALDGTFNVAAKAARLRAQTQARRRPRYGRLRLDRHKHELLALRGASATTAEIRRWLLDRRIRVHHSIQSPADPNGRAARRGNSNTPAETNGDRRNGGKDVPLTKGAARVQCQRRLQGRNRVRIG